MCRATNEAQSVTGPSLFQAGRPRMRCQTISATHCIVLVSSGPGKC